MNLNRLTYICRSWMLKGILRVHGIATLYFRKLEPINCIVYWYT